MFCLSFLFFFVLILLFLCFRREQSTLCYFILFYFFQPLRKSHVRGLIQRKLKKTSYDSLHFRWTIQRSATKSTSKSTCTRPTRIVHLEVISNDVVNVASRAGRLSGRLGRAKQLDCIYLLQSCVIWCDMLKTNRRDFFANRHRYKQKVVVTNARSTPTS